MTGIDPTPARRRSGATPTMMAAAAALAFTAPGAALAADPLHPVVVELFQSQGCSSCPPANANLLALADRPDVLALSWQVTYWDDLGWRDTFGSPAFTARQWDYARAFHHRDVATPEVVVNGREDVIGYRRGEIEGLIRKLDRGDDGPRVEVGADRVDVGAAKGRGEVVLIRYDPRVIPVPIRAGENGGRTLPHRNVVREVRSLGPWDGAARSYAYPSARDGLKTAVLVQAGAGGRILAAGRS